MDEAERWAVSGQWKSVTSSNVKEIRYDARNRILSVRFKGTAKGIKQPVYPYRGVPMILAMKMFDAESKGVFVWESLRDKFPTDGPHG
jgi:hypothetical protein